MRNQSVLRKISALFLTGLAGCAASPDVKKKMDDGYGALKSKDFDAAVTSADALLNAKPPASAAVQAEAHYLKGRAIEEREKPNDAAATSDLQRAREEYIQGLELKPPKPLEASLRAQIANVAYFQDDYATALGQWGMAYNDLPDTESRAWTLYRIGLCQQRLGDWQKADDTFAQVQKNFPNSVPAGRAGPRIGARAFFVQIGVFNNPAGADRAMNDARGQGANPQKSTDAKGATVVRVGPFNLYAAAKASRARLLGKFPDAAIVP